MGKIRVGMGFIRTDNLKKYPKDEFDEVLFSTDDYDFSLLYFLKRAGYLQGDDDQAFLDDFMDKD